MKPYYEDDAVTIYHGDSREIAPTLTADVLITDPPYGIGLVSKRNADYRVRGFDHKGLPPASVIYEDSREHVEGLIASVVRVLVARIGRAVVFPGPKMLFAYPEPASIGAVWTPAGGGRTAWGFQCSHPILYYGKDPYLVDGKGGRPNGFKDDQPGREDLDHPCPKPLPWMLWAVNRASRPGETVIDPFMGSGTTLRAAKNLGRKAIGIEIEERYCEIAARRMGQEVFDLETAA
jgi:site-specific DNA-methyltransferase (adenine-specific)